MTESKDPEPPYWVRSAGDRRALLQGAIDGAIALSSLAAVPHLYALGPGAGIQGEVTVYDGVLAFARVEDGRPRITEDWAGAATFLAYGAAERWRAEALRERVRGQEAVQELVEAAARAAGLPAEAAFPFRIEGRARSLTYHLLRKQGEAPHSPEEHRKSKHRFQLQGAAVKVVGFRADAAGVGVYTHPGRRIHLHFLAEDGLASGHVEDLELEAGARLFLPKAG